uniref:Uncharacterized protein n=1 Tax=Arundo donax TaxID=35708 RepID=A0A0A9DHQ6_ARUDO
MGVRLWKGLCGLHERSLCELLSILHTGRLLKSLIVRPSRTPKEVCKCVISTRKRESRLMGKVYNLYRV